MKIEGVKDKIGAAISKAEKITGKNLTLPVLSCVLLEAKDGTLIVRSTNLDLGIEIAVPVKVEKSGVVAVPGAVLSNVLTSLQDTKNVVFESLEGNLKVTTPKNSTVIKSFSPEDFPTLPRVENGKPFMVSSVDFVRGLKSVAYSAAVQSMKPELSSVYVYTSEDSLVFAATDSFRLAEKRIRVKKLPDLGNILIPYKNIGEIVRVLDEANQDVEVMIGSGQVSFFFGGTYLVSRIVDATFPDYKPVIPKEFSMEVTLLKQDLIQALKIANIFSDKFSKVVIRAFNGTGFEIETKNIDVGENVNKIDAVISGNDIESNFNHRYIVECFQSIDADSIHLGFGGPNKPLVITGIGDKTFTYLVMPMNK